VDEREWLDRRAAGPRYKEVEDYAEREGITFGEAVIVMINRGLSFTEAQR
jgi:hypothetical protein